MGHASYLYFISGAVGIIDTAAVLLRFAARTKCKARLGADDIFIALSLLPLYGMMISSILLLVKGGLGRPISTLKPSEISDFLQLLMATMTTYSLTITSVKISILLLYRRIFTTPLFRKVSFVVGIACVAWLVVEVFMDIFQCRPFSAAFEPALLFTDRCIDLQAFYTGVTVANLGLDAVVLYLPLHMVWQLKLPTRQRMMLSGIFLLGGLSCVAGVMRVISVGTLQREDLALSMVNEYAWSQIEPALALLCACAVTYRPLFTNLNLSQGFAKLSSSLNRSKRGRPKSPDWTDMENSPNAQMQWPQVRDFEGDDLTSQDSGDELPIYGRCEPVVLKPFDQAIAHVPAAKSVTGKPLSPMPEKTTG